MRHGRSRPTTCFPNGHWPETGTPAAQLANEVYGPLTVGDGVLLDTVSAYLDSGGSIEATARAMFIHANTVRYRLSGAQTSRRTTRSIPATLSHCVSH